MMYIDLKILDKKFYNAESNGILLNQLPAYATDGSAAMDLVSTSELLLNPGERAKIKTGVAIWIKSSLIVGVVVPRSGLGTKGLVLANTIGIIDSDYQGELIISAWNSSNNIHKIIPGDRIAQLIFLPILKPKLNVVDDFSINTARGNGGFGSTGV